MFQFEFVFNNRFACHVLLIRQLRQDSRDHVFVIFEITAKGIQTRTPFRIGSGILQYAVEAAAAVIPAKQFHYQP